MTQIKTKLKLKSDIPKEWRILTLLLILPVLLSGFLVLAADLTPESVLSLTNAEREKQNLAPLVANSELNKAAELKANDMLKNDYFSHTSPKGLTPWHWIKEVGYQYQFAGENLAINFDSASEQETAWMKSKTHRENILNSEYTEMGVAVVRGDIKGKTSFVTVVLFGKPLVPVVAKSPEATENLFVPMPAVKGVQTKMAEFRAEELLLPAVSPKQIFQNIKLVWSENKESIFQNIQAISLAVLLMSLSAPAAVFVALGFREIFPHVRHSPVG